MNEAQLNEYVYHINQTKEELVQIFREMERDNPTRKKTVIKVAKEMWPVPLNQAMDCTVKFNAKGKSRKKCAAIWCSHKDTDPCKLFRIPSLPPDLPKNASEQCQITHQVQIFTWHEFLDQLGLPRMIL